MNTKQIFETITLLNSLEEEVKKLHELGEELALNECRIKIKVENFDKKAEQEAKSIIDGGDFAMSVFSYMSVGRASRNAQTTEVEHEIEINDTLGISIVGALINYKKEHINYLKNSLKGVKF